MGWHYDESHGENNTMTEYLVHTTGTVSVEAETKEEAEEYAHSVESERDHMIESAEAEPMQNSENYFKIWLNQVGSSKRCAGYGLWKAKSAMKLAYDTVNVIAKQMVGENNAAGFKYDLAIVLLSSLEGDSLQKDKIWEAVQQQKEDVHERGSEALEEMFAIVDEEEQGEA